MSGRELIEIERGRQVTVENWYAEHDDGYTNHELEDAGDAYLAFYDDKHAKVPHYWPWDKKWWKIDRDPVRNLVKAGALYQAEIDRQKRTVKPDKSTIEWLSGEISFIAMRIDQLTELKELVDGDIRIL